MTPSICTFHKLQSTSNLSDLYKRYWQCKYFCYDSLSYTISTYSVGDWVWLGYFLKALILLDYLEVSTGHGKE